MTTVTYKQVVHELWRRGHLSYKLQPQQRPIYDQIRTLPENVDEAVVLCARQFGKSVLGVLLAIEDCIRYPNRCILIVGPTLVQTKDIVSPRMMLLTQDAPPGLIRRAKSENRWYIGQSELIIGGFDVNSSSQRGKTVQTIYIEEIVDSHPDKYIEAMRSDLGPAMTRSDAGKMIFLTTPPKIPDHPFLTETVVQARLNDAFHKYTIYDNKELSKAQFDACVRRAGGKKSVDFQREYECKVVRDSSIVVVPAFDETKHVRPLQMPGYFNLQIAMDWGGVRDHTVGLLYCYSYHDNRMYVLQEFHCGPNVGTNEIVKGMREMEAERFIKKRAVDAPGQIMVDLSTMHNYDVQLPPKDDWKAQINALNVAFSEDRLWVSPDCPFLIETLRSGVFNKNRTDFERTRTLGHCDAIAALMYGHRTLDRSNPFPDVVPDNTFIPPQENHINLTGKKFGAYNR